MGSSLKEGGSANFEMNPTTVSSHASAATAVVVPGVDGVIHQDGVGVEEEEDGKAEIDFH